MNCSFCRGQSTGGCQHCNPALNPSTVYITTPDALTDLTGRVMNLEMLLGMQSKSIENERILVLSSAILRLREALILVQDADRLARENKPLPLTFLRDKVVAALEETAHCVP